MPAGGRYRCSYLPYALADDLDDLHPTPPPKSLAACIKLFREAGSPDGSQNEVTAATADDKRNAVYRVLPGILCRAKPTSSEIGSLCQCLLNIELTAPPQMIWLTPDSVLATACVMQTKHTCLFLVEQAYSEVQALGTRLRVLKISLGCRVKLVISGGPTISAEGD